MGQMIWLLCPYVEIKPDLKCVQTQSLSIPAVLSEMQARRL